MSNVVVDDTHHVTSFHLNDGNANIDAINQEQEIETWNWQTGAHFDRDNLKVDFMYGDSGATWQRTQLRTAVNYTYGGVDAHITPSGLWSYDLPSGLDLATLPYAALGPVIARRGVQRHGRSGAVAGLHGGSSGTMGQQLHAHLAPGDDG